MSLQDWIDERKHLTQLLYTHPYDLVLYVERAIAYSQLGYHDLAAGDAYLALLLTDEVADEVAEYHEQAKEQLSVHLSHHTGDTTTLTKRCVCLKKRPVDRLPWRLSVTDGHECTRPNLPGDAKKADLHEYLHAKVLLCYSILVHSLLECGCLSDAMIFCNRGLAFDKHDRSLKCSREFLFQAGRCSTDNIEPEAFSAEIKNLPNRGFARREVYPWNVYEPDRFSSETLQALNERIAEVAPRCEVRVTTLPLMGVQPLDSHGNVAPTKQLGLFAKEDIFPGEVFLREKSLMTATNRLHDSLCDACGAILSDPLASRPSSPSSSSSSSSSSSATFTSVVSCPECDDTLFCSQECFELAEASYHRATCGKEKVDSIAKDVPARETSQALYLLLLGRALAMGVAQEKHPLDLPELKYIWGDFSSLPSTTTMTKDTTIQSRLPFDFDHNIASPLHILQALDVDIYCCLATLSDPWIFQTIYAKLRGTASAKISTGDSSTSSSPWVKASAHSTTTTTTTTTPAVAAAGVPDLKQNQATSISGPVVVPRLGKKRSVPIGPDVAAVHPLWCLANHSCAPNVSWEWTRGEMRFWTRPGPVVAPATNHDDDDDDDGGKNEKTVASQGNIIRGDQEIFSHYCDISLSYTDRREWLIGCLGGTCMCPRCLAEEAAHLRSRKGSAGLEQDRANN